MRRLIAAIVVALFASLSAIDGLCCPDGCTNDAQTTLIGEHAPDDGICVLCTGGVNSPVPDVLGPAIDRSADTPSLIVPALNDGSSLPADHPPRS